jgi:TIR domain
MTIKVFISYASQDNGLDGVTRLKRDLTELFNELPAPAEIFLAGTDMRAGQRWPEELRHELSTCNVFLALYSPGYFASEPCAKERAYFEKRRAEHGGAGGLFIPLLWSAPGKIRFPADVVQDFAIGTERRFPESYLRLGLQRLQQSASPERQKILDQYNRGVLELIAGAIQKALDTGGLDLPPADDPARWQLAEPWFSPNPAPETLKIVVSYARADAATDPGHLDRFRWDLSHYLDFVGQPHSIDLVDDDLTAGGAWIADRTRPLRECDVFVPLLSNKYYSSEAAARAWGYFEQRVRGASPGGGRNSQVVPVQWRRGRLINHPREVENSYQLTSGRDPEYIKRGLLGLQELADGALLAETMWRLTEALTSNAGGSLPPAATVPPWDLCEPFFRVLRDPGMRQARPHPLARLAATQTSVNATAQHGPNNFGARTARAVRNHYGPARDNWAPYESCPPVAVIVREILRELGDPAADRPVMDIPLTGGYAPDPEHPNQVMLIDFYLLGYTDHQTAARDFILRTVPSKIIVPMGDSAVRRYADHDSLSTRLGARPGGARRVCTPKDVDSFSTDVRTALAAIVGRGPSFSR